MAMPKVGILADDLLQQHLLRGALINFGFDVVLNTDPSKISTLPLVYPDAWVVNVHCDDENSMHWLDSILSGDAPVLFGVEKAPQKNSPTYPKWEKKLYSKLRELSLAFPLLAADAKSLAQLPTRSNIRVSLPNVFNSDDFSQQIAQRVWVLGASLGGPAAVKMFLDALPAGLPVAFVYAQHIDPRFEATLCKTIGRHSNYTLKMFIEDEPLLCGEVLIAPVEHEFKFDQRLLPQSLETAWPGPYGPSIDQVILNIDQGYNRNAGYIIFSGMGNDGAEAITSLCTPNLPIWAQTPQSCANASMPESAIATGKINFVGTPEQLALQLVDHLKLHWKAPHDSLSY